MRTRDAKDLLKQSRRLAAKASSLSDDAEAELREAREALSAALEAGEPLDEPGDALEKAVDKHLGHLRKGKFREYVESIGVAIVFALMLRAFVVEAFQIPTGSMEPTLLVGDHLFVAKYAYGVRVPFTTRYLFQWRDVQRGDIVVFLFPVEEVATQHTIGEVSQRLDSYANRHGGFPPSLDDAGVPAGDRLDAWGQAFEYELVEGSYRFASAGADGAFGTTDDLHNDNSAFLGGVGDCLDPRSLVVAKDYIKRVIGLPGDRVSMRDNVLYINDQPVPRDDVGPGEGQVHGRNAIAATETLDGEVSYTTWTLGLSPDFDEIIVRDDHVFVMGDNRDNSSDGRCWGQVPIHNVKGQSMFIFFSRDRRPPALGGPPNWFSSIRWSRFFDPVR